MNFASDALKVTICTDFWPFEQFSVLRAGEEETRAFHCLIVIHGLISQNAGDLGKFSIDE